MRFHMKPQNPRIVCADGTSLSVQASELHYCIPRSNTGPYTKVEVGFIEGASPPDTWRLYADSGEVPSDIYAFVPVDLVREFISTHGGIRQGELPC